MDDMSPEEMAEQMEGILKPVIALINNGKGYDQVLDSLLSVYPKMDNEKLQDELLKAYNLADSVGRLSNG